MLKLSGYPRPCEFGFYIRSFHLWCTFVSCVFFVKAYHLMDQFCFHLFFRVFLGLQHF